MDDKAMSVDALLVEWSEWAASNKLAGLSYKNQSSFLNVGSGGFNQVIISSQDEKCLKIEEELNKLPTDEYQAVVIKYLSTSSTVANTNNYTMHRTTVYRKLKRVYEKLYSIFYSVGLIT